MRKLVLLFAFFCTFAMAEMVDTFQFSSNENRVRAINLAKSLRCPQCQNQNLVESNASAAFQLRLEVYEMVEQGKSNQEITQIMTERFGNFVNYQPPMNAQTWVLWGVPFGLLSLLLGAVLWRVKKKK